MDRIVKVNGFSLDYSKLEFAPIRETAEKTNWTAFIFIFKEDHK